MRFNFFSDDMMADLKELFGLELTQMHRDRIVQQKNLDGSRFANLKESTIIQKLGGKNKTSFDAVGMNAELRMMRTQDYYKNAFRWRPTMRGVQIYVSPLPHRYRATMRKKMSKKGKNASYNKVTYEDITSFQLNSASPFYQGKLSKGNAGANYVGATDNDILRIGKKGVKSLENELLKRIEMFIMQAVKK